MSDENNTNLGELLVDTDDSEQVTSLDGQDPDGEGESDAEEQRKAAEREKSKQGQLKAVPDWIKEEIRKEAESNFERQYAEKRDIEKYQELLPKVVKENNLSAEEQEQVQQEVERLRNYRDDKGNRMSYEEALRLATKDLSTSTLKKAMRVASGAMIPKGDHVKPSFNSISSEKFSSMTQEQKKSYMNKSIEMHGEVIFS